LLAVAKLPTCAGNVQPRPDVGFQSHAAEFSVPTTPSAAPPNNRRENLTFLSRWCGWYWELGAAIQSMAGNKTWATLERIDSLRRRQLEIK
jgi:hypothetical protein